jgi:hypothetical protein
MVPGMNETGALLERLEARKPELEQTVLTRVHGVGDSIADPEYALGLKAAVNAAVSYGLSALEAGGSRAEPVPHELLSQARRAARSGVGLDTVLRRYVAGHALLDDFIVQEAGRGGSLQRSELQRVLQAEAVLFDRLIAALAAEYRREAHSRRQSAEQRRAERVKRLLAGELVDSAELRYQFDGWHLGTIAAGPGAPQAMRDLAGVLDRRLLLLHCPDDETVWAWLGGRRRVDPEDLLESIVPETWPSHLSLALGEPSEGLAGWRLTHRQAAAALPIALRSPQVAVRYADVALLASMLQDDLLATSMRQLYLAPLAEARDGGEVARQTLRAYFAAERNVASAAAALGISRQAVNSRLRTIENTLGRPLGDSATELEVALRIEALDPFRPPTPLVPNG